MANGIKPTRENREEMAEWINIIYKLAELKKLDIITPTPIDHAKAEKLGNEWKATMTAEKDSYMERAKQGEIEEANLEASKVAEDRFLGRSRNRDGTWATYFLYSSRLCFRGKVVGLIALARANKYGKQ